MKQALFLVFLSVPFPIRALAQSGLPQAEFGGTIVRDPPEGLRVEDMTRAELQERYAQYKARKLDDRDGYIILNQITFNCGLNRAVMGPECLGFDDEKKSLLKAHPQFNDLQDFRLSSRIRWQAQEEKRIAELAAKRKEEEERPRPTFGRMLLHGDKMALHTDHPRSLRFFDIPPNHAVICAEGTGDFRDQRAPGASGGACSLAFCAAEDITPLPHREGYSPEVRLVSCKRPTEPTPKLIVPLDDWVVIKSPGYVTLEAPFFLANTEYRGEGEGGAITPKAPFSRVYGIDGKVLFELQVKSEPPNSIIAGLGVDKTGAIWGLGRFVTFDNGCDGETSPRKMRKLFLWESSGTTTEIDSSSQTAEVGTLMTRFRIHESYMPWFDWERKADQGKVEPTQTQAQENAIAGMEFFQKDEFKMGVNPLSEYLAVEGMLAAAASPENELELLRRVADSKAGQYSKTYALCILGKRLASMGRSAEARKAYSRIVEVKPPELAFDVARPGISCQEVMDSAPMQPLDFVAKYVPEQFRLNCRAEHYLRRALLPHMYRLLEAKRRLREFYAGRSNPTEGYRNLLLIEYFSQQLLSGMQNINAQDNGLGIAVRNYIEEIIAADRDTAEYSPTRMQASISFVQREKRRLSRADASVQSISIYGPSLLKTSNELRVAAEQARGAFRFSFEERKSECW